VRAEAVLFPGKKSHCRIVSKVDVRAGGRPLSPGGTTGSIVRAFTVTRSTGGPAVIGEVAIGGDDVR